MENFKTTLQEILRNKKMLIIIGAIVVALLGILLVFSIFSKPASSSGNGTENTESELSAEELLALQRAEMISNADRLAASYDYDAGLGRLCRR